jgi:hypothetical protein
MKVTGRCRCGQIGFEAEVDPTQVRICHCTDCQTLTGTAFRTTVPSLPGTFITEPFCQRDPPFASGDQGFESTSLRRRSNLRPTADLVSRRPLLVASLKGIV